MKVSNERRDSGSSPVGILGLVLPGSVHNQLSCNLLRAPNRFFFFLPWIDLTMVDRSSLVSRSFLHVRSQMLIRGSLPSQLPLVPFCWRRVYCRPWVREPSFFPPSIPSRLCKPRSRRRLLGCPLLVPVRQTRVLLTGLFFFLFFPVLISLSRPTFEDRASDSTFYFAPPFILDPFPLVIPLVFFFSCSSRFGRLSDLFLLL